MSISPAISFNPVIEDLSSSTQSQQNSSRPHSQGIASSAESGKVSNAEVETPKSSPAPPQVPEDEVQLQRDSELENEVIVRYVDKAGNLILQVPGAQMLNLERAIAAEFHQPKSQAAAEASKETGQSGESHGH